MIKVKVFEVRSMTDFEMDVNEWIKNNHDIKILSITPHNMFDFWGAGNYVNETPQICNQWISVILTYETSINDKEDRKFNND
jgi:hypothetical protein